MNNILESIIKKKEADLARSGVCFGCEIPKKRVRPIVAFLKESGVILEIKKASPSKGNIAPNLDIIKTAQTYAKSGAKAISVLTEANFFKGSLKDLQKVAQESASIAILRKDFIIRKEEIEVSYLCGADAVLLIARILSKDELATFALECERFGISPFIEIRDESCVEKFRYVAKLLQTPLIAGINSRDLTTFRIDTLLASMYRKSLPKVVFESGILTHQAAKFVAQRGFYGILVGEAAARDPQNAIKIVQGFESGVKNKKENDKNAAFWEKIANLIKAKGQLPLVKICGITNANDAINAANCGADMLGFVFCAQSKRNMGYMENVESMESVKNAESIKPKESVESIIKTLINTLGRDKKPLCIGVLTNLDSKEGKLAIKLAESGILDALQYHDCEIPEPSSLQNIAYYGAIRLKDKNDILKVKNLHALGHCRILIDSFSKENLGGSGKCIESDLVKETSNIAPLWLAGGINPSNIGDIIVRYKPELVDISSGVEEVAGKKDANKLKLFFRNLNKASEEK